MHANLTYVLLWQALVVFLLVGALVGALLGLMLIFRSPMFEQVSGVVNRWIPTSRFELLLNRTISLERWFHQHHQAVGIVIVAGALYILAYFGFQFDKANMVERLGGAMSPVLLEGLLDGLELLALTGAGVSLCVGLFFWLRPSLLRGVEERSNQWVSLSHVTDVLDAPRNQVENFVLRHARPTGWLLLLGSVYLFFLAFRLLA